MARLDWDEAPRDYESGVNQAVLYSDAPAAPWNGLISVEEAAKDAQLLDLYFDGERRIVANSNGDYSASVQAFTYPDLLDDNSDGSKRFGLTYRTTAELGDKLHLVYNAAFVLPEIVHSSETAISTPSTFRWSLDASSVGIPWSRPASHLVVDTGRAHPEAVSILEGWLYGTDTTAPRLPTPEEVEELFESYVLFRVRYNGDGTYTVTGPDDMVQPHADGTFTLVSPSLFMIDDGVFEVSSY